MKKIQSKLQALKEKKESFVFFGHSESIVKKMESFFFAELFFQYTKHTHNTQTHLTHLFLENAG